MNEKSRRLEGHLGEIKEESKGITVVDVLSSQAEQIFFSLVSLRFRSRKKPPCLHCTTLRGAMVTDLAPKLEGGQQHQPHTDTPPENQD